SNGESIGRVDATAAVSGAELVEVARRRAATAVLDPLLDRSLSVTLDFPGLLIGRVANLTGSDQSPAEGRLQGRIALTGTAAAPHLQGQLQIHDMERAQNHMGSMDLYVEGSRNGALLHLGITPPGGGSFLGHANLVADLGGRTLLRRGFGSVAKGELTGDINAKQLDLA